MPQANFSRIPEFYHRYVRLNRGGDVLESMAEAAENVSRSFTDLPPDRWLFRYVPGKWSVKEMLQHIIDAERVFAYRALRFARADQTNLPGFDENLFAANSHADGRETSKLLGEFDLVHRSSKILFESFSEGDLRRSGWANGNEIYVEALGFIIAGHSLHHLNVLQERYP